MKKEAPTKLPARHAKDVAEELDSLNARLRQRGTQAVRRQIEATLESKAKRRRASEKPASSGFKRF
jgi:hypothetical protein